MQQLRRLPHQTDRVFLTDGGIETWLMYKQGFELPHFCDFHFLDDSAGRDALRRYYREFALIAKQFGTGYVFCDLTYRASRDWAQLLGISTARLAELNQESIVFYREIADEVGLDPETTIYSGCIGPRGDAYRTNLALTAESSEDYHAEQIETFCNAGVDLVTALTLNSAAEATGGAPAYYMINCSHPADFGPALNQGEWVRRIRGIRANASSLEHGQLCQLGHLEEGEPPNWHSSIESLRGSTRN
jgi:homocysteine S-methyltransferase